MNPPLYKGSVLFGATSEMQAGPLTFYQKIHRELGHVVHIRTVPGFDFYSVAGAEGVEQILRTNQNNYPKPQIFLDAVSPLTGRGLFTNQGDHWHQQRRMMAPSFHHRRVAEMMDIMKEETQKIIDRWKNKAEKGQSINLKQEMMVLTMNIASRSLFSTDVSMGAGEIGEAVRTAFEYVGYRLNNPFSFSEMLLGKRKKKFEKAKKVLDETVLGIVEKRRKSGNLGNDILGMLLEAKDEETGQGMSDELLRDEMLTLLIAGHETTAAALTWAWYLMVKNPDKGAIFRENIENKTEEEKEKPFVDYARMVFEESMRLYPPAWGVPRFSLEDDEIEGYQIKKGKVINISFWSMFRDPEIWENPDAFIPERFSVEKKKILPRAAFIPFGLGKRQCIGLNMAMIEGPLILEMLAKQFQLSLVDEAEEVKLDATFALHPLREIRMNIEVI